MAQNRLSKLISRFADIQSGERNITLLLFTFFFLITAPHTIIKALRYTNLLDNVGSQGLPLAYILAALATGLVVVLNSKVQVKLSNERLIVASLAFFILTGLLFQVFLDSGTSIITYLYWIWATVLTVVLMTHYGLTLAEVFTSRQARRLIGFCGAGGVLGGMVGGFSASLLTKLNLGNLLLPLACFLLFLCILVVRALFRQRSKQIDSHPSAQAGGSEAHQAGFKEGFRTVRKNRYLILISGIVILTGIIATFVDFQFSSKVEEVFTSAEDIQIFLGLFYGCLTTVAFFLQLLLTKSILEKFKIRFALLFSPMVLLLGSLGIILGGLTLPLVIFYKGSEESLNFSFNQSVREMLYIPIDRVLRYKARPFIDMFINRFARVLAAVLLLIAGLIGQFFGIVEKDLPFVSPVKDPKLAEYLTGVVIVFLVLWIFVNLRINKEYGSVIRNKIRRIISPEERISQTVDLDYTKLLVDTLDSRERSSVLFSMYLFDLLEQDKLTDEVKAVIFRSVDEAKMASLPELFNAEGVNWMPGIEDDLGQEGLITDIKEIMSSDEYEKLMQKHAEGIDHASAETEVERMELAKAIGMMKADSSLAGRLESLIEDSSPSVSRYAMESAARLRAERYIPAVIQRLGSPHVREDAISALRIYGGQALPELEKRLKDAGVDPDLRAAVLTVLSRIGSLEATEILLGEGRGRSGDLDTGVIDALDRIRSENPDVIFPRRAVMRLLSTAIQRYCQAFIEQYRMEDAEDDNEALLEEERRRLQATMDRHFRNIFLLLGLIYSRKAIIGAYQNLKTGTQDSRDNAIEHLDHTLKKDLRDVILRIVEETDPGDRVRKFQQTLKSL
jgi:AAA family ATP:ADP antiporter